MSENNPQNDPKSVLNVVENATGSVPQTDVLQKPKYKAAQNLLEQLEYFKLQFPLKFKHVLWMGLATYMCYDRYQAFQQYREDKQNIFGKNRKLLSEKFGKLNQKYTQSTIHPRGDPDQGDWAYFQELNDQDQKLFLERKLVFQDKSSHFNTFMPLYMTSGLCFPLASVFIGLVFRKKIFNDQLSLNKDQNSQQVISSNIQQVEKQVTAESAQQSNSTDNKNSKNQEVKKQSYINYFIQEKLSINQIYGLIAGCSIVSSIRIIKYFS